MNAAPAGDPSMGYPPYGYGPPSMMPHHMGHGHHGMGHMGGGGDRRGLGNVVPFRAGDWKCGSDGCGYHNFAKNVSCLRCGASRAGAAIVADSAFPSPMDTPGSSYGMGPPSMAGTPGPGPFAGAGAFGPGGFPGQQYGGPQSTYALPSGLGAPSPYPPMGGMNNQYAPNGGMHGPGFDSRAAEAAFSSAGPQSGPGASFSNGGYADGPDPFSFLSSAIGGLSMNDEPRRNTGAGKSPQ